MELLQGSFHRTLRRLLLLFFTPQDGKGREESKGSFKLLAGGQSTGPQIFALHEGNLIFWSSIFADRCNIQIGYSLESAPVKEYPLSNNARLTRIRAEQAALRVGRAGPARDFYLRLEASTKSARAHPRRERRCRWPGGSNRIILLLFNVPRV